MILGQNVWYLHRQTLPFQKRLPSFRAFPRCDLERWSYERLGFYGADLRFWSTPGVPRRLLYEALGRSVPPKRLAARESRKRVAGLRTTAGLESGALAGRVRPTLGGCSAVWRSWRSSRRRAAASPDWRRRRRPTVSPAANRPAPKPASRTRPPHGPIPKCRPGPVAAHPSPADKSTFVCVQWTPLIVDTHLSPTRPYNGNLFECIRVVWSCQSQMSSSLSP